MTSERYWCPAPATPSYPAKPKSFATYEPGWWVVVRSSKKLGRITRVTTQRAQRGSKATFMYRVWLPSATPPRCEWHDRNSLQSATQMQAQAMSLHPLASHTPEDA